MVRPCAPYRPVHTKEPYTKVDLNNYIQKIRILSESQISLYRLINLNGSHLLFLFPTCNTDRLFYHAYKHQFSLLSPARGEITRKEFEVAKASGAIVGCVVPAYKERIPDEAELVD